MTQKPTIQAWGLLFLLALIWGSSFILIKKGLGGLSSLEVGSLRIVSAAVVLFPFVILKINSVHKSRLKYLLLAGLCGSFIPAFLFSIAQTQLPSSITGVLNAMTPIFTMLVGVIFFKQQNIWGKYIGLGMGFLGAAILILSGTGGAFGQINYYAFLVMAATVLYALNSNIIKFHLSGIKALTITGLSLVFVGPFALIVLLGFTDFTEKLLHVPGTIQAVGYILILGVVGTALAMLIFNKIVSLTDPVFTSSVTYIIPIIAVIWGILDGEQLNGAHFIGISTIIVGVYLTNTIKRK